MIIYYIKELLSTRSYIGLTLYITSISTLFAQFSLLSMTLGWVESSSYLTFEL